MKRVLFLLLTFVLWLPVQLRAQDAEALAKGLVAKQAAGEDPYLGAKETRQLLELVEGAATGEDELRRFLILALGRSGQPELSVPFLLELLSRKDLVDELRQETIAGLAWSGDSKLRRASHQAMRPIPTRRKRPVMMVSFQGNWGSSRRARRIRQEAIRAVTTSGTASFSNHQAVLIFPDTLRASLRHSPRLDLGSLMRPHDYYPRKRHSAREMCVIWARKRPGMC